MGPSLLDSREQHRCREIPAFIFRSRLISCATRGSVAPVHHGRDQRRARGRSPAHRGGRRPTRPMKIAVMTGQTAQRPGQLILSVDAVAQRVLADDEHEHLPRDQHVEHPARQQLEVPAHDDARDHQRAVDHRVHQRAQPAVLARDARRRCRRRSRPRRRARRGSPAARRCRRRCTTRGSGTTGSARRAGTRSRSGSSTGSAARRLALSVAAGRTGPGPTAAGRSGGASPQRPHVLCGAGEGHARASTSRRPRRAWRPARAPTPASACRRVSAQWAADQLGVGELRARRRRRGRRRAPGGPWPPARRRARRRPGAPACPPCPAPPARRPTARSTAATRCPRSSPCCSTAAAARRAGPMP